ncbi:sugar phosphate isomerase/epimerase family protein [Actinomadura luteofluorescens]|uniref:Sugar phosphate isomerase/epimerase n=1 Tax=Actinomadura luteofluorescens TaxID=46163 RepID=A0A7Y9JH45_9ACTN|nr:sugar phosphate isomerase/epimerase [Actinomadura luteofluorescens]NYD48952.1 sugar phosphate isomerase/epimerase [Actinomadura luteofluorescens]
MAPQHNGAPSPALRVPDAPITLSTASVYPEKVPSAFEIASLLGYDGIEVMVSTDASSQDLNVLRRLSDYHQVPIKSIHAPCLLLTQRVWGRDPWGKLVRSKDVAEELGAEVVVVHPPFRWQRDYAKEFVEGLARMQDETDVLFAVENMFPLKARGAEAGMYLPDWNPVDQDYPYVTLDLSHTAVSGSDAIDMAGSLGDRLRHIHLADGVGITNKDEHLVPGRGNQPCGAMLENLAEGGFKGHVVLEVNTRRASSRIERMEDLAEALAFARLHLAAAAHTWEVTSAGEITRRGVRR